MYQWNENVNNIDIVKIRWNCKLCRLGDKMNAYFVYADILNCIPNATYLTEKQGNIDITI